MNGAVSIFNEWILELFTPLQLGIQSPENAVMHGTSLMASFQCHRLLNSLFIPTYFQFPIPETIYAGQLQN